MAYKVYIKSGGASIGSTPLRNKQEVVRWVKQAPLGRWNTKVRVENTQSKKTIYGIKAGFSRISKNW